MANGSLTGLYLVQPLEFIYISENHGETQFFQGNAFHRETQFHGETHLFMDLCYRRTEQ